MAKSKAFSDEQLTGPPPEQPSIVKKAARGAISGLSAAANVLDLPGSSVRDVLAGRNPLDNWLTPFSGNNRTSGRDLLRAHGLVGRKDTWGNWGGGMAAEIALDPLTYFTLGGAAIGKAGQAAKAAGVHGQRAANLAARATGKKLGQVGTREARHLLTPRMIQAAEPETFAKMATYAAKQGFDLQSMLDEPLGGVAKFWPTGTVIPGQRLAKGMDQAADAIRHWKIPGTNIMPVADIANQFNAKAINNPRSAAALAASYKLFDEREANNAAGLALKARGSLDLKRAGLQDAPNHEIRMWAELENTAPAAFKPFVKALHQATGPLPKEASQYGVPLGDATEAAKYAGSDAKHVHREATTGIIEKAMGKSGPEFSGFGPEQMKRMEWSHGAKQGSNTIRKMSNAYQEALDQGTVFADEQDIADFLEQTFSGELPGQFLTAKGRMALANYGKHGKSPTIASANALLAKAASGGKVSKDLLDAITPQDAWLAAAKDISNWSPELRKSGVYGNNPIHEAAKGYASVRQMISNGKHVLDHIANVKTVPKGPGTVSIKELMGGVRGTSNKGLGLKAGNRKEGYAKYLIEKLRGKDISKMSKKKAKKWVAALNRRHVDAETAKYLKQFKEGWDAPEQVGEMMKLYDSIHRIVSHTFTSLRPGYGPRNLASGQGSNWFSDQFTGPSIKDAWHLARGEVIVGAAKNYPIVQQMAKERGIQNLDDKMATDLLSEVAYSTESGSKYGLHVQHASQAGPGSSVHDTLEEIPGQHPFRFDEIAQKAAGMGGGTTINPLKGQWGGVFGAEKSTFGPLAAGESVAAFGEHMNRIAPLFANLRQGVDPLEAMQRVNAAQVAYQSRHYTKTEQQVMSRLFQFYKYPKGQVPYVLKMLAEKPGGKLAQVLRGINSFRGEDELTPDYIQETTSIPLGQQPDGSERYLTGLGLNFEDPLSFATPSAQGIGMELMSRTSLPIKGTLEGITGTSFFQRAPHGGGRLLEDMDPALGRTLANVTQGLGLRDPNNKAPVRFPGSGSVEHLLSNSPLAMPINMARTLTDSRKGPLAKASQTLTGVRIADISPASQDKVLRDRIALIEKRLGARTFSDTYFPREVSANLNPKDKELVGTLANLRNILEARSKNRREVQK